MKLLIFSPYFHNNIARIKNLNPLAIIDANRKEPIGADAQPDIIVTILYGIGVSPATNTGQKPKLLYRRLN